MNIESMTFLATAWFSASFQPTDLLLLVPISYFVVFGLHWQSPNEATHSLAWVSPLLHLIAWSVTLTFTKSPPSYISAGWGIMTLSLTVLPLLLDRDHNYPEWLQSSLLLSGLASLLWVYLVTSRTSVTVITVPKLSIWLLAYLGFGFLLTSHMVGWQLKSNYKSPQPALVMTLNKIQILATAALGLSLTITLLSRWNPTPLLWGSLALALIAFGSTLLPTTQPADAKSNPSGMHLVHDQWNRWSSLLTLAWLFLHLIIAA